MVSKIVMADVIESISKEEIIEDKRKAAKRRAAILLMLAALCCISFFFGLGRLALAGPDEPRYAEVAREMYVTGDYISPRIAGCLWFEKPVLLYWMAAASYHLFGVSEFAARFPSALAALVSVLFLFYTIDRALSTGLAVIASVVLATSGIFIGFARAVTTDMALAASMAVAFLAIYLFTLASGRRRAVLWSLGWAAIGLAALAKGLAGIILSVSVLIVYLFIAGHLKSVGWRWWLAGLLIMIAVASAWYAPVVAKHGWAFIDKFIIEHHFHRYLTNRYNHPQPFYYYLLIAPTGLLPWTFFLIPAVSRIRKLKPRISSRDSLVALAWVWVTAMIAFFSLSNSKLPGYILPIFPAMAIIVGNEIERVWEDDRSRLARAAMWMTALLVFAVAIAFPIYLRLESMFLIGWRVFLAWLPMVISAIALAMLAARRTRTFIAVSAATTIAVVAAAVVLLLPVLSERLSLRSLSLQAAQSLRPGERICFFIMKEFAPVFYAEGRVVCGLGGGTVMNALSTGELVTILNQESSLIVFTTSNWVEALEDETGIVIEPIGSQGEARAFRVRLRDE